MKQARLLILLLLTCLLLLGAVNQTAPVAPSKNYFVNDYANAIFREHREKISQLSDQLDKDLDIEAVVLAVPNLGGIPIADYAVAIYDGWQIGGAGGSGVLLLYDASDNQFFILPGGKAAELLTEERVADLLSQRVQPYKAASNYSAAILSGYKGILYELYLDAGLTPAAELYPEERVAPARIPAGPIALVVVALLALLISMRLSRRYRDKYLHRHQPRRKDFTAKHPEYDDMPEDRRARTDEPVRKEGFIIYREDSDGPASKGPSEEDHE